MFCVHQDHMVLDSRGRTKTHTSHWNSHGECRKYTSRRISRREREALYLVLLVIVTGVGIGISEGLVGGLLSGFGVLSCVLGVMYVTRD